MKNVIILISALSLLAVSTASAQQNGQRPKRPDPAQHAAKMLADFDQDGSASLNEAELSAALEAMRANRPRPEGRKQAQVQEQKQPRPERERPDPASMAQRMLENNDTDDDGSLSEQELVTALQNGPRGPGGGRPRGQDKQ